MTFDFKNLPPLSLFTNEASGLIHYRTGFKSQKVKTAERKL